MKTIIHTATGEFRDEQNRFLLEGYSQGWTAAGCPAPLDAAFSLIQIPDVPVNPQLHKWNGHTIVTKTAQELANHTATQLTEKIHDTSRQKDILAVCALVVRSRNISAWNSMTPTQKITVTLAEADAWKNIREFIDKV